jgi:hypothetical protein
VLQVKTEHLSVWHVKTGFRETDQELAQAEVCTTENDDRISGDKSY